MSVPVVATDGISLELDAVPRINYAMHQNGVPLVRELVVRNEGTVPLEDLELLLSSDGAGVVPWKVGVERIDPGGEFRLLRPPVQLDRSTLVNQDERDVSRLTFSLRRDDATLASTTSPLEVLAYNEWAGHGVLPEYLSAFVQPNHADLQPLLRTVSDHLQRWTGDPSLDGYQSRDPARVRKMVAAVYHTLLDMDITYINPPASFERLGQKIRTVESIRSEKMGTCLDLAVLVAGLLEQIGLHPLLPLVVGHAFAGCWLVEDTYPEGVHDDDARLRNGLKLGEIVLFDPTLATHRPEKLAFERAEARGREHLGTGTLTADRRNSGQTLMAVVDVCAARHRGLQPLPARRKGELAYEVVDPEGVAAKRASAPVGDDELRAQAARAARADEIQRAGRDADKTTKSRVEQWKTKLLDLSRRNRLLNFRETQHTLELLAPNLGELEDQLASSVAFEVYPRPDAIAPARAGAEASVDEAAQRFLTDELKARRLRTPETESGTQKKLLAIYRKARNNVQESGTSMLFLAFGFLRWFDQKSGWRKSAAGNSPEGERLAPILLLPLELKRESAGAPFEILLADEEPRVNRTLLEMLRQEFALEVHGVDPPPEDDHGLDVQQIFAQFTRAVKHRKGWEVVERAQVGLFSFSKFLMWHDLEARREELEHHPVVRHLTGTETLKAPGGDGGGGSGFPSRDSLDDDVHPADVLCPLDADSSQLAAVMAAERGHSFVLEGPPGTGKSQTITNLIAHCLTQRKSVLFVSEKRAALEVVQRRLEKIGLGPYCLELHSNKAQKRAVLTQLATALSVKTNGDEARWRAHGDALREVRDELNRYEAAIHRPRALGLSYFRVTSRLVGLQDAALVPMDLEAAERLDRERWADMEEAADKLQKAIVGVGDPAHHPFRAVGCGDLPPARLRQLEGAFGALGTAAERLEAAFRRARSALGLDALPDDPRGTAVLLELDALLATAPGVTEALLTEPGWAALRRDVEGWSTHGRGRQEGWAALDETWNGALLKLPLDTLQARFDKWAHVFFLIAFFMLWSARRELKSATRGGKLPGNKAIPETLRQARGVRDEDLFLSRIDGEGWRLFGRAWKGSETDWAAVMAQVVWAERYRQTLAALAEFGPDIAAARGRLVALASTDIDRMTGPGELPTALDGLRTAREVFEAGKAALVDELQLDEARAWGDLSGPGYLRTVASRCAEWQREHGRLRDWMHYVRTRREAREQELGAFVEAVDGGRVPPDQVVRSCERSVLQWWLDATEGAEDVLRLFQGAEQDRKVHKFRRLDEEGLGMAATEARARVAAGAPRINGAVNRKSALGVLQNEIQKKKRHLATRKLFEATGDLIPKLTPCILMSPLSIAQYLDPKLPPFDLVVFDEASQVPVWDAVGAIARGRQLIVVGDPKQLPPTAFFQRGDSDDAVPDENDVQDQESILDECMAAGMRQMNLGWHYRSRHEHLITFSNRHYYGNNLMTFPAALETADGRGVSWRHVAGGVYDAGGTRTNRAEAEAIVAEIVRRLKDPALQERSIGVVTFSQAQQTLVEDLLDRARRQHPDIERFFSDDDLEPVFVKNLENVQGDERDTILFSICYGPDAEGRVRMSFGPLNRAGGERRLNVAVTRARNEMVVFSTLRPEQIDLNRTSAEGVAHLKSFLEFADRGPGALASATSVPGADDFDSPFEQDVCGALRARGYTIDTQVGCSGYRVDLGVRHPTEPGRYAIGVECDGATYHSAATARDRDRLRQSVLEGLGWRIARVWSTDWFRDRHTQLERLVQEIDAAIQAPAPRPPKRETRRGDAASPPPAVPDVAAIEDVRTNLSRASAVAADPASLPGARPYAVHRLTGVGGAPERFEDPSQDAAIHRAVHALVEHEGPIHVDVVARRVGERWGKTRLTKLLRRRVVGALAPGRNGKIRQHGDFLWPTALDPASYGGFRLPNGDGPSRRDLQYIPLEELANALRAVLSANHELPEIDLLRDTARVFGISQLGRKVRERMTAALDLAESRGVCVREGDGVRLG